MDGFALNLFGHNMQSSGCKLVVSSIPIEHITPNSQKTFVKVDTPQKPTVLSASQHLAIRSRSALNISLTQRTLKNLVRYSQDSIW